MEQRPAYPVRLSIDYVEGERNRLTVGFRLFMLIPIAIVVGLVGGGGAAFQFGGPEMGGSFAAAGGVLFGGPMVMIVFRQKYPRWWFDWNVALLNLENRLSAYAALLGDAYPSTDDEQAVHITIPYPDVPNELNRWLPIVKWFVAIPHYVVLIFLGIAAIVVTIIAWFAILFTGRYPRGTHGFVEGVMRWAVRVQAYAFLLTTDRYPPFSLQP